MKVEMKVKTKPLPPSLPPSELHYVLHSMTCGTVKGGWWFRASETTYAKTDAGTCLSALFNFTQMSMCAGLTGFTRFEIWGSRIG